MPRAKIYGGCSPATSTACGKFMQQSCTCPSMPQVMQRRRKSCYSLTSALQGQLYDQFRRWGWFGPVPLAFGGRLRLLRVWVGGWRRSLTLRMQGPNAQESRASHPAPTPWGLSRHSFSLAHAV